MQNPEDGCKENGRISRDTTTAKAQDLEDRISIKNELESWWIVSTKEVQLGIIKGIIMLG